MDKLNDKYVRSVSNPGVVLNTDNDALKAYKLQKRRLQEIDTLKNEIADIKTTLGLILEKLTNK